MTGNKQFIVVGHPRSGSTFLFTRLAMAVDAFTPQVKHEELFNVYERLFNCCALGLDGSTEKLTAEQFFASSTKPFTGFKTIPSFHREWHDIASMRGVQYLTVARMDFLSSVASTLISERIFLWDLPARHQLSHEPVRFAEWFRDRKKLEIDLGWLLNRLLFDYRSIEQLNARPGTIALTTESIVENSYDASSLSSYFETEIRLRGFWAPTNYRECFEDAESFRDTVVHLLRGFLRNDRWIPEAVAKTMG